MRILILLGVLIVSGCSVKPEVVNESNLFDLPSFSVDVIDNLIEKHPDVDKKFVLNNVSERKSIPNSDSTFWFGELSVLLNTDLNSPRYRGQIKVERGISDSESNLHIDRYSSIGDNHPIKGINIYYLGDVNNVRIINLKLESKNFLSSSEQNITAWFNEYSSKLLLDSIVTVGKENILLQDERAYESHVERIRR